MNDAINFIEEWKKQNDLHAFTQLKYSDVKNDVISVEQGTYIKPISSGIEKLNAHFNYFLGMLFIVTGYPQSGKSELLKFMAALWVHRGLGKVAIFSPESEAPILYHELKKLTGLGDKMDDFFMILEIKDNLGMPEINSLIEQMNGLSDQGFNYFIIDPLNWLTSTQYGGNSFESLRLTLTYLKQFAKRTKSVVGYVEHPKTPQPNKDGEYPPASIFMVSGGTMHNNKVDACLITHRQKSETQYGTRGMTNNDPVLVEVAKLKMQKYLGHPSTIELKYNWLDGSYE